MFVEKSDLPLWAFKTQFKLFAMMCTLPNFETTLAVTSDKVQANVVRKVPVVQCNVSLMYK